jgi:transcriptional regulator with XRE-family HTH domain
MQGKVTPIQVDPPLRAVRVAKGLSLRAVAQRSGIDPGHLSRVERGEKQLSVESLYRLANTLDLRELAQLLKPYLQVKESA